MRGGYVCCLALCLAACAGTPSHSERVDIPPVGGSERHGLVERFSKARPGDAFPSGWRVWKLSGYKKPTHYRLVRDGEHTVVKASADGSASGLVYPVHVDLKTHPILSWRWKVPELIPQADNTRRHTEDAPARLIVAFEGDRDKLPLHERLFAQQFKLFTNTELPYATLMYIWAARTPRDTIIPSSYTGRIKMIVAESGPSKLGEWQEERRNVYEDYKRAFGEEPPPVKSIAIMTDTDNTGARVDAYYGDISFMAPAGTYPD